MTRFVVCAAITGCLCAATLVGARELTFEDRVNAQRAIEQVYWNHRIWPKENPVAKPPLSAVMSDEAIRARVEDYLEKSNALDTWWRRPITGEQLQDELDRMARGSRDPQVLRELFTALSNDPYVIAETLARQTLADRLIRNWYAYDTRFHAETRARAMSALKACSSVDCLRSMDGEYRETTLRLGNIQHDVPRSGGVRALDPEAWREALGRLAKRFDSSRDSIPLRKLSSIEETPESFGVSAVLSQGASEIATASVVWRKQPFDAWWGARSPGEGLDVAVGVAEFHLPATSSSDCIGDTWTATRQDFPDPRDGQTAVWTGSEMIVWGGEDGIDLRSGARYDPVTDTWKATSIGLNAPDGRSQHTAVWTGTEMIVWGGYGTTGRLNSGGRYDPSTDSWKPTSWASGVPSGRFAHTAIWTGSEMIVWGGVDASYTNSGGRYRPSTDSWTPTSTQTNVPDGRESHTAIWTGTEMIVWGGSRPDPYGPSGQHIFDTGGRYFPATDSWLPTPIGGFAPHGRTGHAAVWTGTLMLVWGGLYYNADLENPVSYPILGGRYDPSTNSWTGLYGGQNVPVGRAWTSDVWTGTEMLIWGGSNASVVNSGGLYNPTTDSWRPTSTGANVPRARSRPSSIWTGTEMIIWGGTVAPSGATTTGARYKPASDTWVPTSNGAIEPSARAWHTGVWTGSELIVWGGESFDGGFLYFNSGGRYLPSTDNWTATSTGTNVPEPRASASAVWTGTRMIIWGGYASGPTLNTGGRYDPSTDSWQSTSVGAQVPSGRYGHSAIWTGTQMIVWGGRPTSSTTNTGGRYDPSTDAWTSTSTGTNVPAARYVHTAVWTGTTMVVWGGTLNDDAAYDSGGRYDPTTDAWIPTSRDANTPGARSRHTAVWTGSAMIVWGGCSFDTSASRLCLNSGGRYDPASDSWTATSVGANVPTARENQTAVWTGREMVVWGGRDFSNSKVNSGGRYNPVDDAWRSTSMSGPVPNPREGSEAAWTGAEMIVWGGAPLTASGGAYCARNVCVSDGQPVNCDDGNPCTDDSCDPVSGCLHVNNNGSCDDGNVCTLNDTCSQGTCRGQSVCDDGIPCTDDIADATNNCACTHPISAQGTPCDDGNACTQGTTCDGLGGSVGDCGGGLPVSCNDNSICTDDSCDPGVGCVHTNNPSVCDDGNPCTDDSCDSSTGCRHTNNSLTECDGDACTTGDRCSGGACLLHTGSLNCDDSNPCTDDGCDTVSGCFHLNNNQSCDDGNACTLLDSCVGGACQAGSPVVCNDFNPCTTDACVPSVGCTFTANANTCDDGNACTTGDVCSGGTCQGTPVAVPSEIMNLLVQADKKTYVWDQQPSATRYDVVRGSLSALPVGPGNADEVCLNDLPAATVTDSNNPSVGTGFWYLSRGQSPCGSGTYGTRGIHGSPGAPRTTTTCP